MASKGGSTPKQAALARARERRRKLDRDRDAQDQRIEDAAAAALVALDARGEAEESVTAATAQLGVAVRKLLDEDVTVERAAALLEIDLTEVRRLSKASTQQVQSEPAGDVKVAPAIAAVTPLPSEECQDGDAARRTG